MRVCGPQTPSGGAAAISAWATVRRPRRSTTSTSSRGGSVVDRVAGDRAGHAVAAAAAAAEFGADDGDDLDAGLAQQRVGVGVAVVGEHDPGFHGDQVVAAVPLAALAGVGVATV